jgi:hypothetical protein
MLSSKALRSLRLAADDLRSPSNLCLEGCSFDNWPPFGLDRFDNKASMDDEAPVEVIETRRN